MENFVRTTNPYRPIRALGDGGQGQVYEAVKRGDDTGARFALKKMTCTDESRAVKALIEGDIQMKLDHPHIVRCMDSFIMANPEVENEYWVYLVLELCKGDLMDDVVTRVEGDDKRNYYSEKQLCVWLAQVCSALDFLHSNVHMVKGESGGLIYRDLKPENLLFQRLNDVKWNAFCTENNVDNRILKLGDFGITRVDSRATKTVTGSPFYWAPEIRDGYNRVAGKSRYTQKVDMFSLGAMFFYVSILNLSPNISDESLARMYNTKNYRHLLQSVARKGGPTYSSDWIALILQLIDSDPDLRPSAKQILEAPWMQPYVSASPGGSSKVSSVVPDDQTEMLLQELPKAVADLRVLTHGPAAAPVAESETPKVPLDVLEEGAGTRTPPPRRRLPLFTSPTEEVVTPSRKRTVVQQVMVKGGAGVRMWPVEDDKSQRNSTRVSVLRSEKKPRFFGLRIDGVEKGNDERLVFDFDAIVRMFPVQKGEERVLNLISRQKPQRSRIVNKQETVLEEKQFLEGDETIELRIAFPVHGLEAFLEQLLRVCAEKSKFFGETQVRVREMVFDMERELLAMEGIDLDEGDGEGGVSKTITSLADSIKEVSLR